MKKFYLIFKRIETWSEGENQYRGSLGSFLLTNLKITILYLMLLGASSEAGYKINTDMNGEASRRIWNV